MRKKLLSVLLCTAMVAAMVTGCNKGDSGSSSGGSSSGKKEEAAANVSDDGKVLNIRTWNTEWQERVVDYYPGYEKVDETTGKIGDVTVNWVVVANQDNAYQDALDEALLKQDSASAEEKVDMFLVEADYALKYVDADQTLDIVNDIGVDSSLLANQYKYTQDVVTDSEGKLKGSSWQGCPAGMIYRRDIAKKVFGSDDPEKVQENFSDWDKFAASAKTLKDAGYKITISANDTFRVFSNNVTSKWVTDDNKINVDENIKKWVDVSKELVDAKETGTADLWSDDWYKGMISSGDSFAYFGPAWLIDFTMAGNDDGTFDLADKGQWGLCEGPQSFFWGGTWLCAANGTDNKSLVKDIIEKMTADEEILTKIAKEKHDYPNNSNVTATLESDDSFGDKILGGQNPFKIFNSGISKIDLSNLSNYDQGCNEEFQKAMKEYYEGNVSSYEDALDAFYTAVETKYPGLSH